MSNLALSQGVYSGSYLGGTSYYGSYASGNNAATRVTTNYYLNKGETDKASDSVFSGNSINTRQYQGLLTEADDCFATGIKEGIPLFGLFANADSNNEIADKQINNGESTMNAKDQVIEGTGSVISGGAIGAIGATALGLIPAVAAVPFTWPAIGIGAAIGAVVGLGQYIGKTVASK